MQPSFVLSDDTSLLTKQLTGFLELIKISNWNAGRGGRVDSTSAYCAGGLPIESRHPTSATYVACRECDRLPCLLSRGCTQVTKHASKGSTLALKPKADIIRSSKQGYQWPHKKDMCPPKFFLKQD